MMDVYRADRAERAETALVVLIEELVTGSSTYEEAIAWAVAAAKDTVEVSTLRTRLAAALEKLP